jgi:hypothetical protein
MPANSRDPPLAREPAPHAGEWPPARAGAYPTSAPVRGKVAPGRPLRRPALGAGGDSRRRRRSRSPWVLEPSRRRRCAKRPLPSVAGSSPKDTQPSKQICASKQTRVGAELPRPQTQSGLKAHSLSPAIGPASVPRRCAPRGSSSRRQRGGPTGRERSYAGAAQYPCAEHRGGIPRAAPSATPSTKPGLEARDHLLCPVGP